jgi:hypothetical protein
MHPVATSQMYPKIPENISIVSQKIKEHVHNIAVSFFPRVRKIARTFFGNILIVTSGKNLITGQENICNVSHL